jgi:hypothetical protein
MNNEMQEVSTEIKELVKKELKEYFYFLNNKGVDIVSNTICDGVDSIINEKLRKDLKT